jgi:hypothetical protein
MGTARTRTLEVDDDTTVAEAIDLAAEALQIELRTDRYYDSSQTAASHTRPTVLFDAGRSEPVQLWAVLDSDGGALWDFNP